MFLIIKLLSIFILLIDSMIGILLDLNELTYWMTLLVCLIIPIVLLTTRNNILINVLYILGIILYIAFSTYNFFIWYIAFESVLIPMIYIISKGSSSLISRYRAIYRFTIYTLIGGFILLFVMLFFILFIGNLNWYSFILASPISLSLQLILFPLNLIVYLIKLPVIPFHIWLPDTHGEAPTSGSVILAALLLKLGGIGIIRWLIPIFPFGYLYYRPLLLLLGIISSVYASITTLRHIDIKKLIAYSSIAHMGLLLIALSNFSPIGYKGFLFLLISHGLVSSLLFLLIGSLYVRTGTRYLLYYKGLVNTMPLLSLFLFFSLLFNSSIPPSFSFVAEYLIFQSTFLYEIIGSLNVLLAILLSGIYSMFLFTKIVFSNSNLIYTTDLTLREFILLLPLIFLSFSLSFI